MDERKLIELKKLDDNGVGLAQIATLSAVDADGDTYAKGAFGKQDVIILAGHSWDGVPLGKGQTFEEGDHAFAEFRLNLDTTAGKEWHQALSFDMNPKNGPPLTEWSYGYRVLESSDEVRDGKAVRVLENLEVFEVSPVVKGAGIGTHTVALKGRSQFLTDADEIIAFAERLAAERKAEGKPFRQVWLMQMKDLKARLEHLLANVTKVDEPTDQAKAEHLLAEFSKVSVGAHRWVDRINSEK